MVGSRQARVALAIRAIEARGEQPSARKVAAEAGLYVSQQNGLNGRDSKLYAEAMEAAGYRRVARGATTRYERGR